MIERTVPAEKYSFSTRIAEQVTLINIAPTYVHLKNKIQSLELVDFDRLLVTFEHDVKEISVSEEETLGITIKFKMRYSYEKDNSTKDEIKDENLAELEIDYRVMYSTPKGEIPENIRNEGFPAFAEITTLIQCWPYLRHLVNHLSSEIGVPFTLPILVLKPEVKEAESDIK